MLNYFKTCPICDNNKDLIKIRPYSNEDLEYTACKVLDTTPGNYYHVKNHFVSRYEDHFGNGPFEQLIFSNFVLIFRESSIVAFSWANEKFSQEIQAIINDLDSETLRDFSKIKDIIKNYSILC